MWMTGLISCMCKWEGETLNPEGRIILNGLLSVPESESVKTKLMCSLSISCSFARNKQYLKKKKIMHTKGKGSWLQKLWEGLSLASWSWIPRARHELLCWAEGDSALGEGTVYHLVRDHTSRCSNGHFMLWLHGKDARISKWGKWDTYIT